MQTAEVETHITYVSDECIRCHDAYTRTCVSHDECEMHVHRVVDCDMFVRRLEEARKLVNWYTTGERSNGAASGAQGA